MAVESNKTRHVQFILPTALSVVLFCAVIFGFLLPTFEESTIERKRETLREITATAWTLLQEYQQRSETGELSVEEAQQRAIARMRLLRYGPEGKDYLWINDMSPVIVMHPYRPDLEGQDVSDFVDPQGKRLFVEFVNTVKANGAGYVNYMWQWKDDPNRIVPKMSFVRGFAPWGWVIGTGLYVNDVHEEIAEATKRLTIICVGVMTAVGILSIYVIGHGAAVERKRSKAEAELAEHRDHLEELVQQRTGELAEAHEALRDSEHQLSDIVSFLPDATVVIDCEGKIITWNLALEEMTGVSAEQMLGKGNQEYAIPFYGERRPILIDAILDSSLDVKTMYPNVEFDRDVLSTELYMESFKGGTYLSVTARPLYDAQGNVAGAIESLRDITRRVHTEEELVRHREHLEQLVANRTEDLRKSNENLQHEIHDREEAERELSRTRNYLDNIVDSMPSALIGVDCDGRVTQWNREAERVSSIPSEQAQGQLVGEVFPQLRDNMEEIHEAVRTGVPQRQQRVPREVDGKSRYYDIIVYPLVGGEFGGAVIRIDDVTERAHVEDVMIQTEKMLSVGGLAAGMAHEINNPLGGILQGIQNIDRRISSEMPKNIETAQECGMTMESLRQYLDRREIPQFIAGIKECGSRAATIVSNMLQFSRRSESLHVSTSLVDLIDRTVELASKDYNLKKKYDFRHIEIVREFDTDVPYAPVVSTEIEQVILNIVQNAAQAMQDNPEDRKPRITLRLKSEGERWVRIEIEDNGPGITSEVSKRIFEPFFTTKPVGEGTGLGLSVSYMIITNNHGGQLSVESTPGEGATFIINLPLTRSRR